MSGSEDSLRARLDAWNEDGRLYLWVGSISAVVSWLLIPLFGLLAVFCGYKLYVEEDVVVSAALMAAAGALGVAVWIAYLLTL